MRSIASFPGKMGRQLLIAFAATALYAVVLVTTASAEPRRVQVTLVTGQVMTVTVDVPPGTTVTAAQIPGLPAPPKEIVDLGPVATPTPVPTEVPELPEVPTPDVEVPTPTPTPGNQQGAGRGGNGNGGGGGGSSDGGGPGSGGGEGATLTPDDKVGKLKRHVESATGQVQREVRVQ